MMDVNKVYIGLIHLISNEKKLLLKKHIKLGITPNANMNELKINLNFASLEFLRKLGINNISTNAINEYKDNAILISRPMLLVEYPNSNARINVINKILTKVVKEAQHGFDTLLEYFLLLYEPILGKLLPASSNLRQQKIRCTIR